MDESLTVDRRSPEETFGLLGNELRVAILRALGERPDEPRSFSALQDAVGERDSGKFNYHLRKLTDHFVVQTDEGYRLSLAGEQVVGALLAGTYTADARMDPISIEEPCPECGQAGLYAAYENERVEISCRECESFYNEFVFPPGALDQYDRAELPAALDRWLWTTLGRVVGGFCPTCGGRMDGELVPDEADDYPEPVRGQYVCERCGERASTSASLPCYFHPGVMGFFYDHGIDLTAEPSWRMPTHQDAFSIEEVSADPLRVRVSITIDGDTVAAVVDETMSVVAFERSDREQN